MLNLIQVVGAFTSIVLVKDLMKKCHIVAKQICSSWDEEQSIGSSKYKNDRRGVSCGKHEQILHQGRASDCPKPAYSASFQQLRIAFKHLLLETKKRAIFEFYNVIS